MGKRKGWIMSHNHGGKIVRDGLVLCLDAGNVKSYPESGTSCKDLTGNGYNGALNGGTTFSTSNGGEFVFDGTDDYISVASMYNFATTNQLTAIVWAKSTPSTWNDYGFLLSKRDQFIIHPNISSKDVCCYVNTTTGGWQATCFTPSNIQVYNQYCMTYNGGPLFTYLNGVYAGNITANSTLTSDSGELDIGKDDGLGRYFNGRIGLVQIYNRALSASEILQNYNTTRKRFGL
jgi:hypothetical protein